MVKESSMAVNVQPDRGKSVDTKIPQQSLTQRFDLRRYFSSPSTQGFSAYRTGVGIHLILFVLIGACVTKALTTWTSCPLWCAAVAVWVILFLLRRPAFHLFFQGPSQDA
jgi:hypothetical protein